MERSWFDMYDLRKRKFDKFVWIPLRAIQYKVKEGKYGFIGYKNDLLGLNSVLLPLEMKDDAKKISWSNLGLRYSHGSYIEKDIYYPADHFYDYRSNLSGILPVIIQESMDDIPSPWLLNQDIMIALKLRKENDSWICPSNGYEEAIRIKRNNEGCEELVEIKANYLKDYLCARKMFLYITSYSERKIITDDISNIAWNEGEDRYYSDYERWESHIAPIHEGGHPFGQSAMVIQVERTDVDDDDDIPSLSSPPTDENIKGDSWERHFDGRKLFYVSGELWYNEIILPGTNSPLVRRDEIPSTSYFIIDALNNKINGDMLEDSGNWLWFKPDVISALSNQRYFSLEFFSKDTGSVSCLYGYPIHFGINELGLLNVFAKDIGILPDWLQKIWAGYNITPEGGVSKELLAVQVHVKPPDSQAPESFIESGIEYVNSMAQDKLGINIFKKHTDFSKIIKNTNRFRSLDLQSFYSLAKDIARLSADSLDIESIRKFLKQPTKEKYGSIKTLECLLAQKYGEKNSRKITETLVGIYELRLADAHLPSSKTKDAFNLLNVDRSLPFVIQGYQLLNDYVTCIYVIADVIKNW
jgi:hypothetical protein